jgi:hypothetical protein
MTPEQASVRPDTLEEMIFQLWNICLAEAPDYSVEIEVLQMLIRRTKELAAEAGWPPEYADRYFVSLKDALKARTMGHPTTLQLIRLLEIETEHI